jgi:hypothetical protein
MSLLLSRTSWGVDLGPLLQRSPDGHLTENKRTRFRSECIEELISVHPWASSIEQEIFLLGFDQGERSSGLEGISRCADVGSLETSQLNGARSAKVLVQEGRMVMEICNPENHAGHKTDDGEHKTDRCSNADIAAT